MPNSLYDDQNDIVYVPMSADEWNKLRCGWSEPVQLRVQNDELVLRSLEKTGNLYTAPEEPGRTHGD